jgi:tRNA dimethylallyltransferase
MKFSRIIIIFGPTASGKTKFSYQLAKNFKQAVIINADAMQSYKNLPILTNQPNSEELEMYPHKLFSYLNASEIGTVASWRDKALQEINHALNSGKTPILVGGTGMYIKSLIFGISNIPKISNKTKELVKNINQLEELQKLDPVMANKLKAGDTQRIKRALEVVIETGVSISKFQQLEDNPCFPLQDFTPLFLNVDRQVVYENINNRFDSMIKGGVIEEVKGLLELNLDDSYPIMRAHGVPEIKKHLNGEISLLDAITKAKQNTRNYAKRQFTFYRTQLSFFERVDL